MLIDELRDMRRKNDVMFTLTYVNVVVIKVKTQSGETFARVSIGSQEVNKVSVRTAAQEETTKKKWPTSLGNSRNAIRLIHRTFGMTQAK